MVTKQSLAKNTFYLTVASIAQKVIAFVYFAWIARYVGVADTGAYFLSLAIVTTIAVLDDLGITSVVIRETAKAPEKAKEWARTAMGIKLATMPFTIVLALLTPMVFGYSETVQSLVALAVFVMLADTLSLTFYGILRGLHTLRYEAMGIFFGQSITATIGGAAIALGVATLPILVLALVAGSVWNMVFSAYHVRKHLGWEAFKPTWKNGWAPLKIAFPFFLAAAFVKVYSYVDSYILGIVLGEEAVGIYAVAYKLTYAFQFLPLAFVAALYPTMSANAKDPARLRETLLDAFWYMALLGFPIVFGIFSLAPEIVLAFYGSEFTESILPLQILIFVLVFIFLDFPIGSLLNATDRQMLKTIIGGLTMVINVIANIILIQLYGVEGATIAALVSFAFMLAVDAFYASKITSLRVIDVGRRVIPFFFSAVLMTVLVMWLKTHVHFLLAVPIGAIVYFGAAYAMKGIEERHVSYFVKAFQSKMYGKNTPGNA